jgi:hypothetical protein
MMARTPSSLRSLLVRLSVPFLAAGAVVLTIGCSVTVGAVNPRPNVVVGADAPRFSLDANQVPDTIELDRVTLQKFRTTLSRGFANAVGSKLSKPEAHDSVVLVLDKVEPEMSNLGSIGRFVSMRFRGRWMTPDNRLIAEFAGVAQPRNPTETGKRHIEDVVEVMYERIINGLDEALRRAPQERDNNERRPAAGVSTPRQTKI